MKLIINKFWMSMGPFIAEGEIIGDGDRTRLFKEASQLAQFARYYRPKDCFDTKRDATDDLLGRYIKRKNVLKKALETLDKKRDRALKLIEGMDMP